MTIIYAVSTSSYYDYSIIGLFSNKSDAEIIARQEDGQVEEYILDAPDWENQLLYKSDDLGWNVCISYCNGKEQLNCSQIPLSLIKNNFNVIDSYYLGSWKIMTYIIANNKEQAIKIATERFQKFFAEKALEGKIIPRGKSRY